MTPFNLTLQSDLDVESQRFENKWLFMWHGMTYQGGKTDVDDFCGGRIQYSGIKFGDQQQQIFWRTIDRYLNQKTHESFKRWDGETQGYSRNLRSSSLNETSACLRGFVTKIIHRATDTDRRLRGAGFPHRVDAFNSTTYHSKASVEIEQIKRAYEAMSEDEWISARAALALLGTNHQLAARSICTRAHAGLIKARCARFIRGSQVSDSVDVPAEFWWAEGEAALKQNWMAGDFETWIDRSVRLEAFGVTFRRSDLEKLLPGRVLENVSAPVSKKTVGGRPKSAWSDDLWVEMCRQLYVGDLQPKRQADITKAMATWLSARGEDVADSTVKERARKLWAAIEKPDSE